MSRTAPRSTQRLSALVLAAGIPAMVGEALATRHGAFMGAGTAFWGSILIGLGIAIMAGAIARAARG